VTDSDAKTISALFNVDYSVNQLNNLVEKIKLDENNFGSNIQPLFAMLTSVEDADNSREYVKPFIDIHIFISEYFVQLVGKTSDEVVRGKAYANRLGKYAKAVSTRTTNFTTSSNQPKLSCTRCGYDARSNDAFCSGCGASFTNPIDEQYAYYDDYDFYDSPRSHGRTSFTPPPKSKSILKTDSPEAPKEENILNTYKPGNIVIHKTFGKGTVNVLEGDFIFINFSNGKSKKLSLSMCNEKRLLSHITIDNNNESEDLKRKYTQYQKPVITRAQDNIYDYDTDIPDYNDYLISIDTGVDYGYMEDYGEDM